MLSSIFRKGLVFAVICLFVGVSIVPLVGSRTIISINNAGKTVVSDWCCDCDIWVPDDYDTIQEAIDAAKLGGCICVRNGTYSENIVIEDHNKDGLTLCGEDRNTTIIDALQNNNTILIQSADDVTVTGFTITNSSHEVPYLYTGIRIDDSDSCSIYDNIIQHNGNGIHTHRCLGFSIEGNWVIENLDNGIRVGEGSHGTIGGNYIAENGCEGSQGDGIEIHREVAEIKVRNNIIEHNRADGIWDDTGDRHHISGNTISYNGQAGINLFEGRECVIKENTVHDNNYAGIMLRGGSTNNEISNNKIEDNNIGIYLKDSSSNTISYNNISDNKECGIWLEKSNDNKIRYNKKIVNNGIGIFLEDTSSNVIQYNNILYNDLCIQLTNSRWDRIILNNIESVRGVLLFATFSIVLAPWNWWGQILPPRDRIFKMFSVVIYIPWWPFGEIPINP